MESVERVSRQRIFHHSSVWPATAVDQPRLWELRAGASGVRGGASTFPLAPSALPESSLPGLLSDPGGLSMSQPW